MTNTLKYKNKSISQGIAFETMDGVVNVLGIIAGLSLAGVDSRTIILGAIAAGFANAIANSSGFYVSEESILADKEVNIIKATIVAFLSSLVSALILSIPILLFLPLTGLLASVVLGLTILFILGIVFSSSKTSRTKLGIRYVIIGLFATVAGLLIGVLID